MLVGLSLPNVGDCFVTTDTGTLEYSSQTQLTGFGMARMFTVI